MKICCSDDSCNSFSSRQIQIVVNFISFNTNLQVRELKIKIDFRTLKIFYQESLGHRNEPTRK